MPCKHSELQRELQDLTVCICNIHCHPHGGRVETYISLKAMTSLSHHPSAGSACIKPDINNSVFCQANTIFSIPYKIQVLHLSHMHWQHRRFLLANTCTAQALIASNTALKIEQSSKSHSDVMSLFNSKRVFIWVIMSFRQASKSFSWGY